MDLLFREIGELKFSKELETKINIGLDESSNELVLGITDHEYEFRISVPRPAFKGEAMFLAFQKTQEGNFTYTKFFELAKPEDDFAEMETEHQAINNIPLNTLTHLREIKGGHIGIIDLRDSRAQEQNDIAINEKPIVLRIFAGTLFIYW